MEILGRVTTPSDHILQNAKAVVMDANLPIPVLRETAERASKIGAAVYLDPTSVPKARLVARDHTLLSLITTGFPNLDELRAMALCLLEDSSDPLTITASLEELATIVLSKLNPRGSAQLIVTIGKEGAVLATRESSLSSSMSPTFQRFPADPKATVVNASGAGDSLCGAYIHAVLLGKSPAEAVQAGMRAATLSLASKRTISVDLKP
jgi:pseudouridine kinase